jgi:hypothetical protein
MQRLGLIEIWALYGDGGFRHGLGRCEDGTVLGWGRGVELGRHFGRVEGRAEKEGTGTWGGFGEGTIENVGRRSWYSSKWEAA